MADPVPVWLWCCDSCGAERECLPLAGDDWPDGILRPVGPDCEQCGIPMDYCGDPDAEEVED